MVSFKSDLRIIRQLRKTSADGVVSRRASSSSHCASVNLMPRPMATSWRLRRHKKDRLDGMNWLNHSAFLLSWREMPDGRDGGDTHGQDARDAHGQDVHAPGGGARDTG